MKHALLFLLNVLLYSISFAQDQDDYVNDNRLRFEDYVYKSTIKTVEFHELSWEFSPPIISLNGNEQLYLSFDDLDGDQKQYSITFQHCNSDWTPSDLMISEYINGFYDMNILNSVYASGTMQKYTHYSITFPQANTQNNTHFSKSGNYLLIVYADGNRDNLVLCRRFMVFDNQVNVGATFRQAIGNDQFSKQHIDFTVTPLNADINNPHRDVKIVIQQNNRWDNIAQGMKPAFMNGNQFIYSMDDLATFNGSNEFRYFDVRSVRNLSERVKEIYKDDNLMNHAVLTPDELRVRKPYLFYNDFNGNFLIKSYQANSNSDVEADYVYVDFTLNMPKKEEGAQYYIFGKLSDWRLNPDFKMKYNDITLRYEARIYLKQGYYNYVYMKTFGNAAEAEEVSSEGTFWDTENDYTVLIYFRKIGTYYDQLVACKKLNSLKH